MATLQMEERLWEYIDGLCNEEEKASINLLLHTDKEWKSRYEELVELNRMLHSASLEEPSMRFAQNVMEEIGKYHIAPATKTYINKKLIYGLGGFFITMIAGLLIYFFAHINWSASADSAVAGSIRKIQWNELMNSSYINIFLMVNVVLGLMLLDRYLSNKKEELKLKHKD